MYTKIEEEMIPNNRTQCDFCNQFCPGILYKHYSKITRSFHWHWFCNDTCANCFILTNNCILDS